MFSSYAVAIITADAVRDGLTSFIVQDIEKYLAIKVVMTKGLQLTPEIVAQIYPRIRSRHFYPSVVRNMTLGPSQLLVIRGKDNSTCLKLDLLKGSFKEIDGQVKTTGLRAKYKLPATEDYIQKGYSGTQLLDRMFEARLHTTSTHRETLEHCCLLLDDGDLPLIKKVAPDLYDELKKCHPLLKFLTEQF